MSDAIPDKIKQWQAEHGVALSANAYAALIKMTSLSLSAPPFRLTMRSGVATCNDNPIGDFFDERTAYLVGSLLKALDENNHPEYQGFDVQAHLPAAPAPAGPKP